MTTKGQMILDEVRHLDDGHGNIRSVVEQWIEDNPRRHVKSGVREVAEIWRQAREDGARDLEYDAECQAGE